MSCQFKNECPCYSGWCESPKQDFSSCVEFLIGAYKRAKMDNPKVVYECDRRDCEQCNNSDCNHTKNIRHAKNFQLVGDIFVEVTD